MIQRTFFGPRNERFEDIDDANLLDMVPVAALVISIVAIGISERIEAIGILSIADAMQRIRDEVGELLMRPESAPGKG